MTHPSNKNKLTKEETKGIENSIKDIGIRAIHPEKMEAYAINSERCIISICNCYDVVRTCRSQFFFSNSTNKYANLL